MSVTATPSSSRAMPVLRFALGFALLLAAFYGLESLPACDRLLYYYLVANAHLANDGLCWLGQATQVSGVTIRSLRFAISVRRGCDAIEPAWFFSSAVLAFPVPWRRKVRVLLIGVALILSLNLVRIVTLFLIGLRLPSLFATAHVELWPAAFMILVVVLWINWIKTAAVANRAVREGPSRS